MELQITQRRHNTKNEIEQIIKGYRTEPAKGLVHGFQKDIIQNAWGHRIDVKHGRKWKLNIEFIKNEKGKFLVIEDFGCTGLIGKNYSQLELEEMMISGIFLDENEKLARFSTLNNSGGNTTSAGRFGRGKRMYQAASNNLEYYFDSYTEEKMYIANYVNGSDGTLEKSYEGDRAKSYIFEKTGVDEKIIFGTRIIIVDPVEEILISMRNGKMLENISETWWQIIKKYDAEIVLFYEGEVLGKAEVPDFYKKYMSKNAIYKEYYENIEVNTIYDHKVKRLGIFLADENDEVPENLGNISYYRKDMKIGDVYREYELPIDDKYKKRIFGFIEFEDNSTWEKELEDNEDLQHYGPENRQQRNFQDMKKVIKDKIEEFCITNNLVKRNKEKNDNEELDKLANDLTDFLKDFDFSFDWVTDLGESKNKLFVIEVEKLYPHSPKRNIEFGEVMKFSFKVRKKITDINTKYSYKIFLTTKSGKKEIARNKFKMEKTFQSELISIDYNSFFKECRNSINIEVESLDGKGKKEKIEFPVFVGILEQIETEDFKMSLSYQLPNEGSKTIYPMQAIKGIHVSVQNNSEYDGTFSLSVLTQDVEDRNNTIDAPYRNNNILIEKNSIKEIELENIIFDEKYAARKGPIRIKFILSHIDGVANRDKGERLVQPNFIVLYNTEQMNSTFKLFNPKMERMENEKYRKYKLQSNTEQRRDLIFNISYPLWEEVSEDEKSTLYKMYSIEVMIRAIIQLQFENSDYSIINKTENDVEEMTIQETNELVENAISEYVGKYFEVR